MATKDVFPPRDLPGRSEEWGRKVEDRIEAGESSEAQLSQKVDNGLRAAGGQLAVLGAQVSELTEGRVTRTVAVEEQTFTYFSSTGIPALRATIPLPLPGAFQRPRSATVAGSFQIQHISGDGGNMYAELVLGGNTIWRSGTLSVGLGGSVPPGWTGGEASFAVSFNSSTILPDTLPLELRVWTVDLTSGTRSRSVSGLTISVTYTDPIQQ